ncbi:MAG: hypothetical protein IJX11_00465 [Bacteroidales bacterium]|nr:hypothetical protein [Bacteroidales bacterium]
MIKRIIAFAIVLLTAGLQYRVFAQETLSDGLSDWANEWKRAFSKEGIKDWKPEFTLRLYAGWITEGPMLTGGVRIDEKRSFALMLAHGDTYLDSAPGSLYSLRTGLNFRRYWHLGRRKIFAFYSDLCAGAAWIYKIEGKYHYPDGKQEEVIDDNVGDVLFVGGWQPGIRIRCYRNLHVFLGPTLATDCLGVHLGIGF